MFRYSNRQSVKKKWDHTKKKTTSYKEQDPEKVKKYLEEIENIPEDEIVYVDETGIDQCLYREYGYALRGEKVRAEIVGKKFQRTNIVAGQMAKKIISPMQYSGTTDSELFEFWFEHRLLSCISEGQVIVMDNASFHRKDELSQIAGKYKCRIIFLPPYSPEYNPIEKSWANLKKYLKYHISSFDSLDDAIYSFFQVCYTRI